MMCHTIRHVLKRKVGVTISWKELRKNKAVAKFNNQTTQGKDVTK